MAPPRIVNGVFRSSATGVVTTGAAYANRNAVGGLFTFANAVPLDASGATLTSAVLRDKAGQAGTYDLFLFDAAPTFQIDKVAVALSAADLLKCIGTIQFTAVVLGAAATQGISTRSAIFHAFRIGGTTAALGTSLFGILVTNGTPTYVSASDVSIDLFSQPDWRE